LAGIEAKRIVVVASDILAGGLTKRIVVRSGYCGPGVMTDGGIANTGNEAAGKRTDADILITQYGPAGLLADPKIASSRYADTAVAPYCGVEGSCDRRAGILADARIALIGACGRRAGIDALIRVCALGLRQRGSHGQHGCQRQDRSRCQQRAAKLKVRRRRRDGRRPMRQRISRPSPGAFACTHA
jgi:hypothetical protein